MPTYTKTCQHCGRTFARKHDGRRYRESTSKWRTRKYCTPTCAHADHPGPKPTHGFTRRTPPPPTKPCQHCGAPMHRRRKGNRFAESSGNWRDRKYCTPHCAARAKTHTPPPPPTPPKREEGTDVRLILKDAITYHPYLAIALATPDQIFISTSVFQDHYQHPEGAHE